MGKTVEHISYLERGERWPSFETLLDVAAALGTSPSVLLAGTELQGTELQGTELQGTELQGTAAPVGTKTRRKAGIRKASTGE